jgi:hypothetical protein
MFFHQLLFLVVQNKHLLNVWIHGAVRRCNAAKFGVTFHELATKSSGNSSSCFRFAGPFSDKIWEVSNGISDELCAAWFKSAVVG